MLLVACSTSLNTTSISRDALTFYFGHEIFSQIFVMNETKVEKFSGFCVMGDSPIERICVLPGRVLTQTDNL
jgi:hypothetical protein